MSDEDQEGFELALAFDTDEPEFARGFEAGKLYELAKHNGLCEMESMTFHSTNAEMVVRIIEKTGVPVRAEFTEDPLYMRLLVDDELFELLEYMHSCHWSDWPTGEERPHGFARVIVRGDFDRDERYNRVPWAEMRSKLERLRDAGLIAGCMCGNCRGEWEVGRPGGKLLLARKPDFDLYPEGGGPDEHGHPH